MDCLQTNDMEITGHLLCDDNSPPSLFLDFARPNQKSSGELYENRSDRFSAGDKSYENK